MLEYDYVVLSAFSNHNSARVSLLVGRNLEAGVYLVFASDRNRLIVAEKFRVPGCYGLYVQLHYGERLLFSAVGTVPYEPRSRQFKWAIGMRSLTSN